MSIFNLSSSVIFHGCEIYISCVFMAGRSREVEAFVTKPLTNLGAGQVYSECGSTHVFLTVMIIMAFMFVDYLFSIRSRCDLFKLIGYGEFGGDICVRVCSTVVERYSITR